MLSALNTGLCGTHKRRNLITLATRRVRQRHSLILKGFEHQTDLHYFCHEVHSDCFRIGSMTLTLVKQWLPEMSSLPICSAIITTVHGLRIYFEQINSLFPKYMNGKTSPRTESVPTRLCKLGHEILHQLRDTNNFRIQIIYIPTWNIKSMRDRMNQWSFEKGKGISLSTLQSLTQ